MQHKDKIFLGQYDPPLSGEGALQANEAALITKKALRENRYDLYKRFKTRAGHGGAYRQSGRHTKYRRAARTS